MKLPAHDFYLLRVAYFAHIEENENLDEEDEALAEDEDFDLFEFLAVILESHRTKDLDSLSEPLRSVVVRFRTGQMMGALLPPDHIRNRIFTHEEYNALKESGATVRIPDGDLNVAISKGLCVSSVIRKELAHLVGQLEKCARLAADRSQGDA